VVEALSKGIINKVLHAPVTNLRAPQPRQDRRNAMAVIRQLFDLNDDPNES
jgi:glutamyl-tRNA reductase